jgi:predicted ester cyclase
MTGDFLGMPASGRSATWEEIHIGRMGGGQLREHWAVLDQLGMLQQLGFVSPPPG